MPGELLSTIAPDDSLAFYDKKVLQPKVVVDFLGLSNRDVAKVAGVSPNSVRYDVGIPKDMQERLEQIATICNLVAHHFSGDAKKTALWFTTC